MIPNWLLQRAYLTPNKTAFTFNEDSWTFSELKDKAMNLAGKMRHLQLAEGNRVALLGGSTADMVFMIHACMLAGVEIVMLNNRLSKKEIEWQVEDANPTVIFVFDEFADCLSDHKGRIILFSTLEKTSEETFEVCEQWEPDRTVTIMYTSGTTGFPKGVRQTAGNHVSSALSSVLNLGLAEDDVWLCSVPLFHISGFSILVRSVLYGMEVRLYEKFNAKEVATEVKNGSVTRISVVALTLDRIIRELEEGGSCAHPAFKTMLAGGGPVPVPYLKRAELVGIPVLQTYGMTETSSQTSTLPAADALRKMGSAGKPLFFNQIKIKKQPGANEIGEVMIRGPHVTPGYIGRFASVDPLENGWLPTGDVGYLDSEGYLFVVDRRADLIISGGENIYPAEIEAILSAHPSVIEVGVCGQAHLEWGAVPVAFIVSSEEIPTEELQAFCNERLATYKIPKSFHFVEALPRNASNKLMRRELKKWLDC